jgi:hypothetical protein
MSGKSRRKRSKQHPSRKVRGQQRSAATIRPPAAPQPGEPVTRPEAISSPATVPLQSGKPQSIQFPYIATELRTIGILTAIMLIVLIVLYFILV